MHIYFFIFKIIYYIMRKQLPTLEMTSTEPELENFSISNYDWEKYCGVDPYGYCTIIQQGDAVQPMEPPILVSNIINHIKDGGVIKCNWRNETPWKGEGKLVYEQDVGWVQCDFGAQPQTQSSSSDSIFKSH